MNMHASVTTVADNIIDKSLLADIIVSIINEEDHSEELKLKIIHALSGIQEPDEVVALGAQFYKDLY